MKKRTQGNKRVGIAAALAIVLTLTLPSSSWAYWSASASPANADLQTATVPTPTGFSCTPSGGLLGLGSTANYSWTPLPSTGLPDETQWRYIVHLRNGTIDQPLAASGQAEASVKIGSGLLSGLLGGLLSLLLDGEPINVSVSAIHPSGWESERTDEIPMRRATILGGITC